MRMRGGAISSRRRQSFSSRARSVSPVVLYCGCGRRAIRHIAQTSTNRGRPFYTCSIHKDEFGYCGYFIWVDKLIKALKNDKAAEAYGIELGRDCEIPKKRGRKRQNMDD